jgi:WD40 repeat protein
VFWALAYSPDGSTLAGLVQSGESPRHEVRVWDLTTWEETVIVVSDDPDAMPRGLAFSPDGTEFAVRAPTDRGAPVVFYNLTGEELRRCCEHPQPDWYYASVEYSPDGRHLLTTGTDSTTEEGTVKLWELATGKEVSLEGHHDAALLGTFSLDGSRIASSGDSEIILWDVATLQPLTVLQERDATAMGLSFSPDGRRLVSVGYDPPLVRVWATDTDALVELARSRVFRTFTAAECEIYEVNPCPALE